MSDIVSDAKDWLEWRPPFRSSQDGRTHSEDCHRVHVDCLVSRLVAEVQRHRMTPVERVALKVASLWFADRTAINDYLERTEPTEAGRE